MLVTKVNAGEQRNCGLILHPNDSDMKFRCRGAWLEVPLSDVSLQDGIITCVPSYNSRNNIFEMYNDGQEYSPWQYGRRLYILANHSGSLGKSYDYDSDLVTFEEGEFYTSSKGMKLAIQSFRPADEWAIQCIAAFYGVNITVYEPALNPLNARDVYCTTPNFQLQIEKSGIKTGQFIL